MKFGQTTNPFATTMIKLQVPEHMGDAVSMEGFELGVDEDRCVEVPKDLAQRLRDHGLKDWTPPAEAKAHHHQPAITRAKKA